MAKRLAESLKEFRLFTSDISMTKTEFLFYFVHSFYQTMVLREILNVSKYISHPVCGMFELVRVGNFVKDLRFFHSFRLHFPVTRKSFSMTN